MKTEMELYCRLLDPAAFENQGLLFCWWQIKQQLQNGGERSLYHPIEKDFTNFLAAKNYSSVQLILSDTNTVDGDKDL